MIFFLHQRRIQVKRFHLKYLFHKFSSMLDVLLRKIWVDHQPGISGIIPFESVTHFTFHFYTLRNSTLCIQWVLLSLTLLKPWLYVHKLIQVTKWLDSYEKEANRVCFDIYLVSQLDRRSLVFHFHSFEQTQ